eukprot:941391-Ditylum_brightwellii.AAC.1
MGGQTTLHLAVDMYHDGNVDKYTVNIPGTPVPTVIDMEDCHLFSYCLNKINENIFKLFTTTTIAGAIKHTKKCGYS